MELPNTNEPNPDEQPETPVSSEVPTVPEAVRRSAAWLLDEVAMAPSPDTSHLTPERRELIDAIQSGQFKPFSADADATPQE